MNSTSVVSGRVPIKTIGPFEPVAVGRTGVAEQSTWSRNGTRDHINTTRLNQRENNQEKDFEFEINKCYLCINNTNE